MSVITETDLRELAAAGARELDGATATDLLRWTDEHFGGEYVVASNMQDAVLIDMASKLRPGVDVLFLDTGYHFAETIGTRDAVSEVYDINVVNVTPERSVAEQDALLGKNLFARDPNECCRLRKVAPLGKALRGYSAWVTGLRRVEAATRANAPLISFDTSFGLVKINPLATWTDQDVADYIEANNVMVNPLVFEGYPSIGCAPCTARPAEGADPRSGRWQGRDKVECGLHSG
jgi:phosphoadenosine phosphosulfate reductase